MTPFIVYVLWVWGAFALATAICAAACRWGGPAERITGATLWIAWTLSLVVGFTTHKTLDSLVVVIDCLCLAVFVGVALKWRHVWTLLVAASQLDDVMSHFAARMTHFGLWSYAVVAGLWGGDLIMIVLLVATINYRRRQKRRQAQAHPDTAAA